MKRYNHKKCRRYGLKLCQNVKCPASRRNYPPGVHGVKRSKRLTEYGQQLAEKQKARIIYNLLEKKFRNYFEEATKKRGDTADNFLRFLELRLDNALYRLGLAKTRQQAKQIVSHNHVLINGKKVNIPSYRLKVNDVISLREKSRTSLLFQEILPNIDMNKIPNWLNWDSADLLGKVIQAPQTEELKKIINTKMIIEFYSR